MFLARQERISSGLGHQQDAHNQASQHISSNIFLQIIFWEPVQNRKETKNDILGSGWIALETVGFCGKLPEVSIWFLLRLQVDHRIRSALIIGLKLLKVLT